MKSYSFGLNTCELSITPPAGRAAGTMNLTVKGSVSTGVEDAVADDVVAPVYNTLGVMVKREAHRSDLDNLAPGLYIFNGQRVLVK